MKTHWGKKYSGPHMRWMLTRQRQPVTTNVVVDEPVKSAIIRADVHAQIYAPPLLFDTEEDIDKVLAEIQKEKP